MVLSVLQRKQGIYNYRFVTSSKNKMGTTVGPLWGPWCDLYDIITPRCDHRKPSAESVKNSCDIRDYYDFFGIDHFPNSHNILIIHSKIKHLPILCNFCDERSYLYATMALPSALHDQFWPGTG
jgi:hypothetical protein